MSEAALKKTEIFDASPEVKQQLASHPASSVWVNASAGSGKTTVLTNRVMRLLLDGVRPETILCLTYTRAAAAEMANRVTEKLSFWATCSDNDLHASIAGLQGAKPTPKQMLEARRLFARVLACPGGMRIRTLHAFCQEILRRFPVEASLPPHFAVIEEADAHALQEDVQRDLLRQAGEDPTGDLGRALQTLVLNLSEYGFAEAMRSVLSERPRLQTAVVNAHHASSECLAACT
jgi:ATP-dependent helicase/nuclease subunit A